MNLNKNIIKEIDVVFFYLSVFMLTQSIKLSSKFLFIALTLSLIKSLITKDYKWYKKHRNMINISNLKP